MKYDFQCPECGCKEYLYAENDYEKVLICDNCEEMFVVEQKQPIPQPNIPRCIICGSANIKPISATERVVSVAGLGLFSKKINKSYKCLNCKATW